MCSCMLKRNFPLLDGTLLRCQSTGGCWEMLQVFWVLIDFTSDLVNCWALSLHSGSWPRLSSHTMVLRVSGCSMLCPQLRLSLALDSGSMYLFRCSLRSFFGELHLQVLIFHVVSSLIILGAPRFFSSQCLFCSQPPLSTLLLLVWSSHIINAMILISLALPFWISFCPLLPSWTVLACSVDYFPPWPEHAVLFCGFPLTPLKGDVSFLEGHSCEPALSSHGSLLVTL